MDRSRTLCSVLCRPANVLTCPPQPRAEQIKDLALSQIDEQEGKKGEQLRDLNSCGHDHSVNGGASYDCLSNTALGELTDRHVAETVKAVAESSIVKDAWAQGRQLSVHGWVYHVSLLGVCCEGRPENGG